MSQASPIEQIPTEIVRKICSYLREPAEQSEIDEYNMERASHTIFVGEYRGDILTSKSTEVVMHITNAETAFMCAIYQVLSLPHGGG
jgi:hypothetical protein